MYRNIQTKNRARIYNFVVITVPKRLLSCTSQVHAFHFHVDGTDFHREGISGFIRFSLSHGLPNKKQAVGLSSGHFQLVLHQCHPDLTLGEQNSDQSLHLRMETDSHNQRHKSYRGTCRTVTTATGRAGGWGGSWGHHHRLSEIGCWWFGATVQLSWLFCPLRDTESGSLVFNLPWSGRRLSRFMMERWGRL